MTEASREMVVRRLRRALGPVEPLSATRLSGGWYNSAWLLELAGGRRLVLKSAPPADAPALSHECGLLGTERVFHRLAGEAGVPVPTVLHHESAAEDGVSEWLLLEYLDGTTMDAARDRIAPGARAALRRGLGAAVARIAGVTGTEYGYPQPTAPPLGASDWPTAFARMLGAVLADAERFGVALPVPPDRLAGLPARCAAQLAEVKRPALVHFDAWEGNVVVRRRPSGAWELVGLIDGERAFFGDPLAELVGLDPLGAAEHDADLIAGYRSVDPDLTLDEAASARLALYRVYLALIMRVEAAPRGYGADHRAWLTSWSETRVTDQLAVLDRLLG
ncbi:phosphotransferase family protein [Streptomyces sp. enrichment culture]|uniref:phosphotransferase family protein n=1 Tax=Streptomyces sp. enrichment culture TaxID=1795815 RepID=UPI003F56BC56